MSVGRGYALTLAVFAALGAGLALLRGMTYGVGLHFDSIGYIDAARSLLAGEGFTVSPWWPPLYPMLLAAAGFLTGLDPHTVAGPLNALLFGLIIFAAGYWLRQRIASRLLALWGCLAVGSALHLTTVASWTLSEPAFILFVTLAMFAIDQHLRDDKRGSLIWAALFVALACLTRYIGLILLITLLPFLLLRPGAPPLEKLKHGAAFALIAVMPLGLWMLNSLLRTGALFGSPPAPRNTLNRILNVMLIELSEWVLPHPLADEGQWYAVAPIVTALGAAAAFALAAAIGFALIRACRKPDARRGWIFFCLHGSFVLIYFITIAIVSKFWGMDVGWGNRRYWTPGYIPLLFALIFLLDRLLIWLRQQPWAGSAVRLPMIGTLARGGTAVLGVLLFVWLGNNVRLNGLAIIRANSEEAGHFDRGYAAPGWRDNDVIRFIREARLEGAIFSNSPAGLHIHTNPANDFLFPPPTLERLKQKIKETAGDVYLVFFNDAIPIPPSPYSYGLAELEAMPALEQMARLDSGVVFRVNRDQADETES